jgi:hypothetical protein
MSGKQAWEYCLRSTYLDPAIAVNLANQLGREGWELVCIDRQENWIFKRELVVVDVIHDPPAPQQVEQPRVHRPASARRNGRRTAE